MIVFSALLGLIVGYLHRELREYLKRIEAALRILVDRQAKEEQQTKKMTFAQPMTMEELNELEDEERINALNQ